MRIINEKGVFDIRPANKADLEYILPSWMRTWLRSPEWNQPGVLRDEYFRHAHLILDELISRASAAGSLYVCHYPGAPHLIRGYLCAEAFQEPAIAYIHWVQVKKAEWDKGVASALLEAFKTDFDVQPNQNLLYTFSARSLKNRELASLASERHNIVYWPAFKYTSQDFGWEAG